MKMALEKVGGFTATKNGISPVWIEVLRDPDSKTYAAKVEGKRELAVSSVGGAGLILEIPVLLNVLRDEYGFSVVGESSSESIGWLFD